ncbi:hypothetical protein [Corynebacterium sp. HFH0082]|uniref:hypothetical protein n=1 Tax=Corynebacterium sp. HFH0082 TaxID=1078764 RepID=UPI00155ACB9B|nr:hypothetical protein [Corynebacterium sp. HFH0082]
MSSSSSTVVSAVKYWQYSGAVRSSVDMVRPLSCVVWTGAGRSVQAIKLRIRKLSARWIGLHRAGTGVGRASVVIAYPQTVPTMVTLDGSGRASSSTQVAGWAANHNRGQ